MEQKSRVDVVLVGRDKAPTLAGQMLEVELCKQGYTTRSFFGDGKPIGAPVHEIAKAALDANLVWVGMSSSSELARPEIAAARSAVAARNVLALYADIEGCQNRGFFEEFREKADLLFVLTEREKESASRLYSKNVTILATDNPTHEEFAFPKLSRQDVRKRLNIADDETLLLALGTKSIPITCFLVMGVLEAIKNSQRMEPRKYCIALFTHPGDEGMRALVPVKEKGVVRVKPEALISELASYADSDGYVWFKCLDPYADIKTFAGDVRVEIVQGTKEFGTPHAIAGADAVIQIAGTEGRRAAYQGIPVIDFFSYLGRNRMKEINKIETWEPCELGMSYGIYDGNINELAQVLDWILTPEGRKDCIEGQFEACPPPKARGAAVQAMVEAMRPYLDIAKK